MVVVVPALAECKQGHPKAVPGIISSAEAPSTPHMRGGVDEPGRVETYYGPKEDAPQDVAPPSNGKKQAGEYSDRYPVPATDPNLKSVLAKLGYERQELCLVLLHSLPRENPTHVGPETAVVGRMGISLFIGVLMMHAVGRNPEK